VSICRDTQHLQRKPPIFAAISPPIIEAVARSSVLSGYCPLGQCPHVQFPVGRSRYFVQSILDENPLHQIDLPAPALLPAN